MYFTMKFTEKVSEERKNRAINDAESTDQLVGKN